MKTLIILALLSCACVSMAQTYHEPKTYDFSNVDIRKISKEKLRRSYDSVYYASSLDSMAQLMHYHFEHTYTPKYASLDIGYEGQTSSLSELNRGLRNMGYEDINDFFSGVHFGFSIKGKRSVFMYNINIMTNASSNNDDVKLTLRASMVDLVYGYALVNAKRFQFYPQVGLGFQTFGLDVLRKAAPAEIKDVPSLITSGGTTSLTKTNFIFSYGLEADYHISYSDSGGGIILGVRYGGTSDIIYGKFKVYKKKSALNLSDRLANSYISVLLKFYMRTE